jgi:menaquinone-dependent protoporphyrinogen oxidase
MPTSILVAYATKYGSTQEVAEAVAATLRESGLTVAVQPACEVRSLEGYDAVVLGAALYMFRWHKDALGFLSKHRKALIERPVAVFALGPTHSPHDEKEWQGSRGQLDKQLAKYSWLKPVAVEILGGKFDPAKLSFPFNKFAGKEPATDIRDWAAVRAWASTISNLLSQQPA